ncbi:hypothetical protein Herbaro_09415 [Herbaspirillum sp. WKF16]|uniref:hypothetical protein n=1 Tax=Herbaspirillum sp. WKF16 TaxID=3028312 RepID=UPI0023AA1607|nr:hypothetical protein [Herbaspirillum sp. WKF16]WDZ97978.1 hypothetical protein Herbaro_09415 [Herbaspirillum sp. WKF16]
MNAEKLQDKIYAGYGKAALRLGMDNVQFRPAGAGNPLATAGVTLKASFNAEDMKYGKANKYGNAVWWGLFDARLTQAGDYLVGPQGTFFIASQQLHLPIQCVQCNRRIALSRAATQSGVGAVGYGGPCGTAGDQVVVGEPGGSIADTGWPASILLFGQRERSATGLPGSVQQIGWRILLPASVPPGVVINAGDIITDDLGRRYACQGAELTDMGWRITSTELHA